MGNKLKYILLIVIAITSILLVSCQEGSVYPIVPVDNNSSIIDSGYYPYTAGSYWEYQLMYFKGARFVDTVKETIEYTYLQRDGSRTINIRYNYMGLNYPITEVLKNNIVSRINFFSNLEIQEKLHLPLNVGDTLYGSCKIFNDSTYTEQSGIIRTIVSELAAIIIGNKNFMAYRIETVLTDSTYPNYSIPIAREEQYFVPYVGFVMGSYEAIWDQFYQQYTMQSSWELIDYNVIKP